MSTYRNANAKICKDMSDAFDKFADELDKKLIAEERKEEEKIKIKDALIYAESVQHKPGIKFKCLGDIDYIKCGASVFFRYKGRLYRKAGLEELLNG